MTWSGDLKCVCGHALLDHCELIEGTPQTGACKLCGCMDYGVLQPPPLGTVLPSHIGELVHAIDRHTSALVLVHELTVPTPYNTALKLWAQRTLRDAAAASIADEKERREAIPDAFVACSVCHGVGYSDEPLPGSSLPDSFCLRCAGTGLMLMPKPRDPKPEEETSDEVQGD